MLGYCARSVRTISRIVVTIGKHIVAKQALSGGDEGIRVEESADFGIVISGLQVIEPGLSGVWAAKLGHGYMTHTPQRGISYGKRWAVFRDLFRANTDFL